MKLFLGIFCLLALTACGKKVTDSKTPDSDYYTVEEELLDMVNAHRSKLGLNPLISSSVISDVASGHSKDMAMRRRPLGSVGLKARCSSIRYELGQGSECEENVAMGSSASSVFEGWMNNPRQRLQIEGNYTHTGLGMAENDKGLVYWTQIFLNIR